MASRLVRTRCAQQTRRGGPPPLDALGVLRPVVWVSVFALVAAADAARVVAGERALWELAGRRGTQFTALLVYLVCIACAPAVGQRGVWSHGRLLPLLAVVLRARAAHASGCDGVVRVGASASTCGVREDVVLAGHVCGAGAGRWWVREFVWNEEA